MCVSISMKLCNMYISIQGSLYRVLLTDMTGSWVINTNAPYRISFFSAEAIREMTHVPEPQEIYKNRKKIENHFLSKTQLLKYEMIDELLNDEKCIFDKKQLKSKCAKIAIEYNTTATKVERTYKKFLATYSLWNKSSSRKKRRSREMLANFNWAIKNVYFNSHRVSLRDTYDIMLLEKYMNDGQLQENVPSFSAFRRYYYEKGYHRKLGKTITRNGKGNFTNNERILYGSAETWRTQIGSFQMDATMADIYLVSRFNRKDVVGRPNVYLAVDTVTQLITGVYVGFESGFSAVAACLYNCIENKVEYCHRYDMDIEPWQWPNAELPGEIITDQGSEFAGERANDLCIHYGIVCHAMPPFRPDRKGIVEMTFDLLQKRYKGLLRGKGVVEEDAQERWATDYRKQAVLTLDEFTKILIRCIVYLNSGRVLQNKQPTPEMSASSVPMIPARLWTWNYIQRNINLVKAEKQEFYLFALEQIKTTVQRKGIAVNGLWYSQMNMDQKGYVVGDIVIALYDKNDLSRIWIQKGKEYEEIPLSGAVEQFSKISAEEFRIYRKHQLEVQAKQTDTSQKIKLQMLSDIQAIAEKAEKEKNTQLDWELPIFDLSEDGKDEK